MHSLISVLEGKGNVESIPFHLLWFASGSSAINETESTVYSIFRLIPTTTQLTATAAGAASNNKAVRYFLG